MESSTTTAWIMPHFSLINLRRRENLEFPKWPSLSSALCFPCHLINWWCKRLKGGQDWQTEVCKLEAGGEQEDQNINTRPECQGNAVKKAKRKSTQIIKQKHWHFHDALPLAEGMWSLDAWPWVSNQVSKENKGDKSGVPPVIEATYAKLHSRTEELH